MVSGLSSTCALLVAFIAPNCFAASAQSWDGTWSGMLNEREPVSVTIADGKVVAYTIRGGQPFPIGYNTETTGTTRSAFNALAARARWARPTARWATALRRSSGNEPL